jgi:hypothetical protein
MKRGLQAGFGELLGPDLLRDVAALGIQVIRADLQRLTDPAIALAQVAELHAAGVVPLLIIRPVQATWFRPDTPVDLELLNEPDLGGWTPERYAMMVQSVYAQVGSTHRLWAGSVSNCTKTRLAWLAAVIGRLPPDVGVTVHRYPKNGGRPGDGQDGFKLRLAELDALRRLVAGRRWGCSEFGYHTGTQTTGWWLWRKSWRWTDGQVAAFADMEWEFWQRAGASFAIWYQLNDGVTGDPIDRFGIGDGTAGGSLSRRPSGDQHDG